jgi:hypothetical protein
VVVDVPHARLLGVPSVYDNESSEAWFRLFRVRLKNNGGSLIRNIKVRLTKIDPNPGLPTPLDLKKMVTTQRNLAPE